jgi:NADH-quinone oxidoreductase subunit J
MLIENLVFYVFSAVMLVSAVMVVTARNPVHSVLFLILVFLNAAVLFLLAGAEFLAMVLVIVYVGAVAVLFLFVVMMLDVDFAVLAEGFQRYAPVGALVAVVLFVELALVFAGWPLAAPAGAAARTASFGNNAQALGALIYTTYLPLFQLAGMVLLTSMIGAIVLTHRDRRRAKTQDLTRQHGRTPATTLTLVQAGLGAGAAMPVRETAQQAAP